MHSGTARLAALAQSLHAELAPASALQVHGCTDQREVRERLREVPQQLPGAHVHLLGEQPEWRAEVEEPLEAALRLLEVAAVGERVHQPERGQEERTLITPEAVLALVHQVALDEHTLAEVLRDGAHRRKNARILVGEKAHLAHAQDRCIERVVVELLGE